LFITSILFCISEGIIKKIVGNKSLLIYRGIASVVFLLIGYNARKMDTHLVDLQGHLRNLK
jgi:hypothetical protein